MYEKLEAASAAAGMRDRMAAERDPSTLFGGATSAKFSAAPQFNDFGTSWLLTAAEAVFIVLVGVASGVAYSRIALGANGPLRAFAGTAVLVAIVFCGSLRLIEGNRRLRTRFTRVRDEAAAWVSTFLLFAFVAFSMKVGQSFSRGAVLTFFFAGFVAVEVFRATAPRFVARQYGRRAFGWNDVLLIGSQDAAALELLKQDIIAAGFPNSTSLTLDVSCDDERWTSELQGAIGRVLDQARTSRYGEIYVAAEGFPQARLADLIAELRLVPRAVRLVPEPATARMLQMPVHNIGQACAVELQKAPLSRAQWLFKRCMDLTLAVVAAIFLAPLLAIVATAIKLDSRGPVIFRQTRLGYRSQPFDIFKFRSMTVQENGDEVTAARKGDQRVTRVGRLLRKTSIDELPQLFNVIAGKMSLVGPRPHARAHDALYATLIENYELRQHVKPGITGWAQVNGLRGETAELELMRQRVEYDMWYAKNASIALDMAILLRTVVEVFRQRNAY
jgi:Undecaprenyl-phosphate glucose phosphotransferase